MLRTLLTVAHRCIRGAAHRLLDPEQIQPREFANVVLREVAPHFQGDVLNVSGWRDEDGAGGHYRDYFRNAARYAVSNLPGDREKGLGSSGSGELSLDLSRPLPSALHGGFDVVLNHTTLEHVFEVETAFANLCVLSRDAVILIVPVLQHGHNSEYFGDWWRFTPMGLVRWFRKYGLTTIVLRCNEQPFAPVYAVAVASRFPERHVGIARPLEFTFGRALYGSGLRQEFVERNLQG
ncbi:MAG: hypothetical protein HYY93_03955 [Planctomycetes bacterium]|nr:hypothetical protein [Planctomycetota bacterium]